MQRKISPRIACSLLLLISIFLWSSITYVVVMDYMDLLNHLDKVQVSIITLWCPIGMLGAVLSLIFMSPKAIYLGKGIGKVYSPKAMQLANKVTIYFALAGVAFAAGWTYHSIDLLEKNGYVYSRDLTKITPTGIHLMYVKAR
ncbi:hypothetical protein APB76_01965 [Vibrio bivalvicida]|uniref:Uncharacterized protein n=2 Tax=Vibrio bivalvicida TaxID=1276888 RepID=A0A177Y4U5_9VIBR|nr:hypothetical protein APB76_01965 [Vibrio bivalvicida]